MTKKFGRISYKHQQGAECCAQMVLYHLTEGPLTILDYRTKKTTLSADLYETEEEQFKDFNERLELHLTELKADQLDGEYNEDEDVYYESKEKYSYGFLSMTLIEKGNNEKPQIMGFIPWLLENGWKVDVRCINPKTKNTVVHLSRLLE